MNQIARKLLPMSAFLVAATLASYATAKPVDCAKPAIGNGEVQACGAAAQGVSELRQFIQRTRGIYILYMQDFAGAVRPN